MTPMTVRRALADYLRHSRPQAPAGDGPALDERAARSAAALTDLATWVESLPPDDERLQTLAAQSTGGGFRPGEEARWMVWRYGTGRIAEDRDVWLRDFAVACQADAGRGPRVIDLTDEG